MLGCLDLAYNPQLFAVCAAASAFSGDSASDADGFASEGSDDDGRSTPSGTTQKDTERFALAFGAAVGSAPALISLNLCCTGLPRAAAGCCVLSVWATHTLKQSQRKMTLTTSPLFNRSDIA